MAINNEALFARGVYDTADHVAAGDISGGTVVLIGALPAVSQHDIATGVTGAVAVGGGVYRMIADALIAAGVIVYWDDTAKKATATALGNAVMGYTVSASGADGDEIEVAHRPTGAVGA